MEKEVIFIYQPKNSLYVTSDEAIAQMGSLKLLSLVKAIGTEEKDITNETLKEGMKKNTVAYGGSYAEPDKKELVKSKIDLCISTNDILPLADDEARIKKDGMTAKEYRERFNKLCEDYAFLGIPMLVDRSSAEKYELGKQEWIKVYGVLFGKEADAEKQFASMKEDAVSKGTERAFNER